MQPLTGNLRAQLWPRDDLHTGTMFLVWKLDLQLLLLAGGITPAYTAALRGHWVITRVGAVNCLARAAGIWLSETLVRRESADRAQQHRLRHLRRASCDAGGQWTRAAEIVYH
ncbi:hypothetical protein M8818_002562 [Zalaria obscura]|uniref:Uncharacterized protein n=1 Tax=Zalaria obscura TaxID=2024903 RepID=A0ACC3SGV6_9PEZI